MYVLGQNSHGAPEKLNMYAVTCKIDPGIKIWYILW